MAKNELRDGAIGMDADSDDAEAIRESGPGIKKARQEADIIVLRNIRGRIKRSASKNLDRSQREDSSAETPVGAEFRMIRERFYRRKAQEALDNAAESGTKTLRGRRHDSVRQGNVTTKSVSDRPAPYVARPSREKTPRVLTPFQEQVLELFNEAEDLFDAYIMDLRDYPENSERITSHFQEKKIQLFLRHFQSLTSDVMTPENVTTLLRAWLRIHFHHDARVENLRKCASSLIALRKEGRKMDDVLKAISSRAPQSPSIDDSRNLYTMGFAHDESNSGDPDTELHYIGPSLDAPGKYSEEPETDLPEYEPPEDLQ